jgi:hypothetical protein
MDRLCDRYRINAANLAARRRFLRFDRRDVAVLRSLAGWARRSAPAIAREFYDVQFAFAPTAEFFAGQSRRLGVGLGPLRQTLEAAQAGYFLRIFEEAAGAGEFGPDFFERRLRVGQAHNVIDLPLKWYVGSYATYMDLVRKHLRRAFFWAPWKVARAERAIFLVFNYDCQAVTDAFFYDYLQSIGFDLERVPIERAEHDLSDHYGELKQAVRAALVETAHAGVQLSAQSRELRAAAESLASGTQEQAAALEQTTAALEGVLRAVQSNANEAQEARRLAVGGTEDGTAPGASATGELNVVSVISGISESSRRIAHIITMIDGIAFQTNLLALNAAVEAARAGEQGRGFAVVAGEVRHLAQRSAEAAKEIKGLIEGTVRQVDEGSTFVRQVAERIATVARVSGEQARGVREVGTAVREIDQATQANAAGAEELAATATQLENEAVTLQEVVSRFRLEAAAVSEGHRRAA